MAMASLQVGSGQERRSDDHRGLSTISASTTPILEFLSLVVLCRSLQSGERHVKRVPLMDSSSSVDHLAGEEEAESPFFPGAASAAAGALRAQNLRRYDRHFFSL